MNDKSAYKLNIGILKNQSLKKVRLNFCFFKREILQIVIPGLSKHMNIVELDLGANNLGDDCRYLIK